MYFFIEIMPMRQDPDKQNKLHSEKVIKWLWFLLSHQETVKVFEKLYIPDVVVPAYTHEDAVARAYLANTLMHGTDSILRSSVETLMVRGLTKIAGTEDKYTWNADLRLRIPAPFNLVFEQVQNYLLIFIDDGWLLRELG